MAKVIVIGSGFSGLAAACYAAQNGHDVTIYEKNSSIGGRARQFKQDGFVFDMGPSWYWMPDVFESFFNDFGKTCSDYYTLKKLDPGFQMFFSNNPSLNVPAKKDELLEAFECIEAGSAKKLEKFLSEAEYKYNVGMNGLVQKPALSWFEYMNQEVLGGILKSHLFKSVRSYVSSYFKDERLRSLMEFPVLFLGAMPDKIPALYTLMNYSALEQGTWYPMGGMFEVVEAMATLAESLGVKIETNNPVEKINVIKGRAEGVNIHNGFKPADVVIATGDYHHVEQKILEPEYRNYNEKYWEKKTFAPSCLIFYLGIDKKIKGLEHHNLFFDADFKQHAQEIYTDKRWPEDPLFYVCCPSKTDNSVAPSGKENLFVLIPIATGLDDSEDNRERYYKEAIKRIEFKTGESVAEHIVYKSSYCVNDFMSDYNAYGGNAYGLANTLMQTAVLKPSIKNKKVKNLFYSGQLTVPGPGVPPALISGKISAGLVEKYLKKEKYEEAFV